MSFRPYLLTACLSAGLTLGAYAPYAAEGGKVHFHGYGEVHSNNDLDHDRVLDVHRAVIGMKAELAPKAFFNLELDFEHAFSEPEMEFAFVDWVFNPNVTARFGHMLMPMGPLNEFHEPPLFLSVERSQFNTKFIPTTWNEVGAGVVLAFPEQGLGLRAYLVNGLKGSGLFASKGASGIRGARYKGIGVRAEDVAGIVRLEYSPVMGLSLGASGYFGGADQVSHADSQITAGLYEADLRYRVAGFELSGQAGMGRIGGSFFEETLDADPRAMLAYNVEASYSLHDLLGAGSRLAPFARYEYVNLNTDPIQPAAPAAAVPDAGEQIIAAGLAFFPVPNLAFKADAEFWTSENSAGYTAKSGKKSDTKTVLNLGIGLMY